MNSLQRFLVVLKNARGTDERTATQEVAIAPLKVKRRLGPNDRIVYLEESNPVDVNFCRVSMGNMFSKGWFDICPVRDCMELLGVSRYNTENTFERLRLLHCVHWGSMPADMREQIPEMISELFTEGAYPGNLGDIVSDQ